MLSLPLVADKNNDSSTPDLTLQLFNTLKSISFQVSLMLQLPLHHLHVFLDLLLSYRLQLASSFLLFSQLLQLVISLLQVRMLHTYTQTHRH